MLTKPLINWRKDTLMNKYCVLMTNRANQDIIDIGDYIVNK